MAGDSNYPSVKLLLPMTGSDTSTTFIDTETTPKTITANDNAQIDTALTDPFGGNAGVGMFDGTEDYLSTPNSTDFDFGSGDLTIDGYVYIAANSTADYGGNRSASICNTWNSGIPSLSGWIFSLVGDTTTTGTGLAFDTWSGSNATQFRATTTVSQSAWHHIEVDIASGTRYLFLDGTLLSGSTNTVGSGYTQANSLGNALRVGMTAATSYPLPLNGYISNLRITKGVARHTASFTPPSAAFLPYAGQLTGNVTEGSYSYISKWLVKAWKSFSASIYKEQVVTGTTYTVDLPTLDPYVLACSPYIDGKWEANKVVTLGQFYTTSNPETSAHLWEVTTAGTFGATEASWNLSGTTTQGTAILTYVGTLPNPSILGPKIPS